jgi:phthalate 4,5-dioxygenase reductase component
MSADNALVPLIVAGVRAVARGIRLVELRDAQGRDLPSFSPGAHVDVSTGAQSRSRHWLCNAPAQADRYEILVADDAASDHSRTPMRCLRVGSSVQSSLPGDAFALSDRAPSLLLVGEGIGIAPIMSMLRHVGSGSERDVRAFCLAADEASTPFAEELRAVAWRDRVVIHHDHGNADDALDFWPVLERPSGAHLYCCAHRALLESIRDMTGHWPASRIHFEAIGGTDETRRSDDRQFRVNLARSGVVVDVAAGQTILDALRGAGHEVPSSCESGTCGTCRTRLLAGIADHRDLVLSDDEQHDYIMVCVSRARTAELTIDR